MENWRKRWERFMFTEDMIVGGGTVLNPKPETYSDFVRMLDDIENFISQELDRAREEGKIEILTDIWDISTTERGKDINWCGEIIAEWVNNYLSKLTTK